MGTFSTESITGAPPPRVTPFRDECRFIASQVSDPTALKNKGGFVQGPTAARGP